MNALLIIVLLVVVAAVIGWFVYNHLQRRGKVLISTSANRPPQSAADTNEEDQP